jgi:hypothetical protein
MADFRLAAGSPGEGSASDGADLGVNDWEHLGPDTARFTDGRWTVDWSRVP